MCSRSLLKIAEAFKTFDVQANAETKCQWKNEEFPQQIYYFSAIFTKQNMNKSTNYRHHNITIHTRLAIKIFHFFLPSFHIVYVSLLSSFHRLLCVFCCFLNKRTQKNILSYRWISSLFIATRGLSFRRQTNWVFHIQHSFVLHSWVFFFSVQFLGSVVMFIYKSI